MSSDKEKRSKAEALLSQFKEETSKIEGLDTALQQYLDQRFDRIEEMLEKILKRMDWREKDISKTINNNNMKELRQIQEYLEEQFRETK